MYVHTYIYIYAATVSVCSSQKNVHPYSFCENLRSNIHMETSDHKWYYIATLPPFPTKSASMTL